MVDGETKAETRSESGGSTGSIREPVRVRLLGGFSVRVGDRTVERDEWRLRKAAALVKLLALAPDHRRHRDWIMDRLWPELGKRSASNNLRRTLHAARKALDPAVGSRYLASEDEQLALCPVGPLWVDVEAFEAATATARREREPAAYRAALDLYAEELLPADRYEEWAEVRRRELRQLHLALLAELAAIHEDRSEHDPAIDALRRVVAEEPVREEGHTSLMRLYALSGRQSEALRQYEILREALTRELGTEPSASSLALREEIARGLFSSPAAGTIPDGDGADDAGKHNLPAQRTSFVGREREMAEVKRALAMTRLLTLSGAGGSGKTRLALEVARDVASAYPDGVRLVQLAPLSDGGLVPRAVAEAVGVTEQPGRPIADSLVAFLREREVLLVTDNCEHLVGATARLVDVLLDSCPRLRILATSRELLGVAGELNWPVPTLSVPDERSFDVEAVEGHEATRLFAVRASYRRQGFFVTPENARAVASICRHLDGIPLAIELAAARVGALSARQIAQRLDDSLELLTGGGRTTVPRHRTLEAALDWSHELLGERERVVFRRLAVFAGGWTLGAAEKVSGLEEDVLYLHSGLVDKSLVVAEVDERGGIRYRLLEPTRQYALEKLRESDEAEQIQRRHAEHYLALAESAESEIVGPGQIEWFARLDAEHSNIRAALSWALGQGETELGQRIAGALRDYWFGRGYFGEGRRWLEESLATGDSGSMAVRVKALDALGLLANWQGDMERVEAAAEEGLRLSAGTEVENHVAAYLRGAMGDVARVRGDYEQAEEWFEEGLALCQEVGDRRVRTWLLASMTNLALARDDYQRAGEIFDDAIALARELDDALTLGILLNGQGFVLLLLGEYQRATAMSQEAVTLSRERGYGGSLVHAIDTLAWALLQDGDRGRALALHREGLVLCKDQDDRLSATASLEGLACEAATAGEARRTAMLFGQARALREAANFSLLSKERAMHEPYLRAARSRLDDASWEAAFAEGHAMTFEDAVEYALSVEDSASSPSPALDGSSNHSRSNDLTRREREVAELVSRGLTNRQISSELVLSAHTVHHHVANILKKLGLHSREQVASRLREQ
jgi:predicted ATPase/DNA-binding SARP family transcriptional activator/DNA-binding CsgD family transcriptional regulator